VTPLPLHLETVSAGFAALTPSAREAGAAIACAAAGALAAELGVPVRIEALPVPGIPSPALATSALTFELATPGGRLVLEVDARLASGLAAILGGGDGDVAPARAVIPVERAALELLALVALSGARSVEAVAGLAPRLIRGGAPVREALAVELTVRAGALRGHARVLVPGGALAHLERRSLAAVPDVRVAAGLRSGTLTLSAADARALGAGDVALVDAGPRREALGFPGGLVLTGRLDGDGFTVEERTMDEWNGSFPIALSIEIARVNVALRDLAGLAPGGVLPLNVARDGRVTLRAGEVAVGRGELVEVDGALAVRIAAWDGCK
jgi:type III secretion system YscQ/HrcQ family protein